MSLNTVVFLFLSVHPFIGSVLAQGNRDVSSIKFPKDFIFSAASSAFQVEGAWNEGGKGENIWDRLVHTNRSAIKDESTGDIACDSYHKYKEDIRLLKTIGFKMYRFSISWSRIFPGGFITKPHLEAVRYYRRLIDELLANGIEPMVTIYHWDLPQPIQDIGGWLNPIIVDIFGEYARAIFKLFGSKVKWWITINGPQLISKGYAGEFAPNLYLDNFGLYTSGHNVIKAHARAYRIYDREFRRLQRGKVSFALNGDYYIPNDPNSPTDLAAVETKLQISIGWFAHPIYSKDGDYPKVLKELVPKNGCVEGINLHSCLPEFTKQEMNEVKGTFDFLGLNHYSSNLVVNGTVISPNPRWRPTGCPRRQIVPEGFSGAIRWLRREYDDPPIFIIENGYCGSSDFDDDEARIDYFTSYLRELVRAIDEGAKVIGYTIWSLLDNFEWLEGYTQKFGIVKIDFNDPNRKRTFKDSAKFFKQLIEENNNSDDKWVTDLWEK